jgi:hypothetical protein
MEGEGTVRISTFTRRNKGALTVSITNTDRDIIDWMQFRWPGYCKPVSVGPGRKPAWAWAIAANVALRFLGSIEPYVITKRMKHRIDAARRWQKIKGKPWQYRTEEDAEESFACYHWMAELNRRGLSR